MANRKKCPAANPERDRVKEIFRKNIQIAKKLQHEGYRDTLEMYDLSEKYCARRVKAVTHLIPEMRKRYAAKFPDMDIAEEFTLHLRSTRHTTSWITAFFCVRALQSGCLIRSWRTRARWN